MTKRVAKTLSIVDIMDMFGSEQKAVAWFEKERWNGRPFCPHCGGLDNIKPYPSKAFIYHHNDCRKAFTVKTKTIMHSSKIEVRIWLMAIYMIMTSRKSVSSLQLSKELGMTQKSAWFMLQRIREACKDGGFRLSGVVEIDETYIGGKEANKHESKRTKGRQGGAGKAIILGMRERGGKTKAMHIKGIDGKTLHNAIYDNVATGATIYTGELRGYSGVGGMICKHEKVNHSAKEYVNGMASTNGIESVWAVLKRGYYGTYHQFSHKHLRRYVDEFSFRLNEGNCKIDTIERISSPVKASANKRLTYKKLTA